MTGMHDGESDELTLTAFRYVAGELSSEEQRTFESLLEADLDAQQALADIVLICDAIVDSPDAFQPQRVQRRAASGRSPGRARGFAVMAAVGAVLVVLLALWTGFPTGLDVAGDGSTGVTQGEEVDSIVSIWSQLGAADGDDGVAETFDDPDEETPWSNFPTG
ncbi:MAG: hypothetical protein DWQ29_20375 [Planctomycetota bacterium]|nr:MAG: hypothetical protein DWQ29_20375 [Planctomycetota bacterium]